MSKFSDAYYQIMGEWPNLMPVQDYKDRTFIDNFIDKFFNTAAAGILEANQLNADGLYLVKCRFLILILVLFKYYDTMGHTEKYEAENKNYFWMLNQVNLADNEIGVIFRKHQARTKTVIMTKKFTINFIDFISYAVTEPDNQNPFKIYFHLQFTLDDKHRNLVSDGNDLHLLFKRVLAKC